MELQKILEPNPVSLLNGFLLQALTIPALLSQRTAPDTQSSAAKTEEACTMDVTDLSLCASGFLTTVEAAVMVGLCSFTTSAVDFLGTECRGSTCDIIGPESQSQTPNAHPNHGLCGGTCIEYIGIGGGIAKIPGGGPGGGGNKNPGGGPIGGGNTPDVAESTRSGFAPGGNGGGGGTGNTRSNDNAIGRSSIRSPVRSAISSS